jgi:hypothetical protein
MHTHLHSPAHYLTSSLSSVIFIRIYSYEYIFIRAHIHTLTSTPSRLSAARTFPPQTECPQTVAQEPQGGGSQVALRWRRRGAEQSSVLDSCEVTGFARLTLYRQCTVRKGVSPGQKRGGRRAGRRSRRRRGRPPRPQCPPSPDADSRPVGGWVWVGGRGWTHVYVCVCACVCVCVVCGWGVEGFLLVLDILPHQPLVGGLTDCACVRACVCVRVHEKVCVRDCVSSATTRASSCCPVSFRAHSGCIHVSTPPCGIICACRCVQVRVW